MTEAVDAAVVRALQSLKRSNASKPFRVPVDTKQYVDYVPRVGQPMDVGKLEVRHRSGVYKRDPGQEIQRRFNVGVLEAISERKAWHASSSPREMIARRKMSQNEWTPTEIRGF